MRSSTTLLDILAVVGRVIRETRTMFGWSQRELSRRSGVPQSLISDLERSRATTVRLADIDALLTALRVTYRFSAELPHVAGPRQADAVHASCVAHVVRRLRGNGWDVRREVEIRDRRSSGWIDVLAWDDARRRLLVVEVKTEIRDLGDIERTMAWYEREAPGVARSFGWHSRQTRSALLVLHSRANDERVATLRESMAQAFPIRADDLLAGLGGAVELPSGRALAMVDPLSRRRRWLRPTRSDGRRSPAPYEDYVAAVRQIDAPPRRRPPSTAGDRPGDQSVTAVHGPSSALPPSVTGRDAPRSAVSR